MSKALQQYLDLYQSQQSLVFNGSCEPMNAVRNRAFQLLQQHGLPTSKTETYKYTNVEEVLLPDYGLNLQRIPLRQNPYQTFRCNVPHLETWNFYVVNDSVAVPDTCNNQLPEGVTVASMKDFSTKNPAFIEKYYHQEASRRFDALTELNTLLSQDGIIVHVAAGVQPEKSIQLVHLSSATVDFMSNRRLLVVLEEGATATLLLCDHAQGDNHYLNTFVSEIFVGKNAHMDFYHVEETSEQSHSFSNYYIRQAADSNVAFNGLHLRSGLSRNHLNVSLTGENATLSAAGAVIADGQEHCDYNILVKHQAPACSSDLLYKYVLDENSVGAFAGKVLVEKGAQKTVSQQTNANLCVSPTARAFTQPMLEIYADDVKCNHGSTVGKFDETALFYMRQRGIPEQEARLLLQHAFINEVLQRISIPSLQNRLSHLVEKRFRGQLATCEGCKMSELCI